MPAPTAILTTLATQLIVQIAEQLAYEANSVQADLDQYLSGVSSSGMTEESIRALVFGGESVTARTFTDSFKSKILRIIDGAINKSWGDGMAARQMQTGLDSIYEWRAESGNPCPDCASRNGQKRSMAEWSIAGLPRSGWSLCRSNCKCILDKTGSGNFNYKRKRGLG